MHIFWTYTQPSPSQTTPHAITCQPLLYHVWTSLHEYITSDTPHTYFASNYISYTSIFHIPNHHTIKLTHAYTPETSSHTSYMRTPYQIPITLTQGISHINGYLTSPTTHPIQNITHSTLQTYHTHFLSSLHIYAHTMNAYIPSPTSIFLHTHIHIAGAQICQSHKQSSYIPGIPISPPCSKTRQHPWIKEHEGSWQHKVGKLR